MPLKAESQQIWMFFSLPAGLRSSALYFIWPFGAMLPPYSHLFVGTSSYLSSA